MERRDGTVVRVLASHQCPNGSIPNRCRKWVDFVVGSSFALRVILQVLQVLQIVIGCIYYSMV